MDYLTTVAVLVVIAGALFWFKSRSKANPPSEPTDSNEPNPIEQERSARYPKKIQ